MREFLLSSSQQLAGLVRLGLSMQRNNLLEMRASFVKMPAMVKGACEELSQLFVVVDRTYADFYRSQLQEVRPSLMGQSKCIE